MFRELITYHVQEVSRLLNKPRLLNFQFNTRTSELKIRFSFQNAKLPSRDNYSEPYKQNVLQYVNAKWHLKRKWQSDVKPFTTRKQDSKCERNKRTKNNSTTKIQGKGTIAKWTLICSKRRIMHRLKSLNDERFLLTHTRSKCKPQCLPSSQ